MLNGLRIVEAVIAWILNWAFPLVAAIGLAVAVPGFAQGWSTNGLLRLTTSALLVAWLVIVRHQRLDDFKRLFTASRQSMVVGAMVGIAYTAVGYLIVVAIHFIDRSPNVVDGTWNPWVATRSLAEFSLAFFVVFVVIGPLVEEFVHRGIAYAGLRSRFRILPAALISSVVFALGHEWRLHVFIETFAFGMVVVWLVERYRSSMPAIAAHVAANLAVVIMGWALYHVFGVPGSFVG